MANTEVIEMAIRCCENVRNTSVTNHITASMDISIEALEKQIPKKPKMHKIAWLGDYTYAYECPNCRRCFTLKGTFENRNKYCDICGQAIDWGEVE